QSALGIVGILAPLLLVHGIVAGELRSGVALLWLQKPVSPVRLYLGRAADAVGLAALLLAAFGGLLAALAAATGGPSLAADVLYNVPVAVLIGGCLGVTVYAFSAWGARLD